MRTDHGSTFDVRSACIKPGRWISAFVLAFFTLSISAVTIAAETDVSCERGNYQTCLYEKLSTASIGKRHSDLVDSVSKAKALIEKQADLGARASAMATTLREFRNGDFAARLGASDAAILRKEIERAIAWFERTSTGNSPPDITPPTLDQWKLDSAGSAAPGGLPAQRLIDAGCILPPDSHPGPPGKCPDVFRESVGYGEVVYAVRETLDAFNRKIRTEVVGLFQERGRNWNAYFYGTQFQYPWELWANRVVDDWRDVPRDEFDNELGLRAPPRSRYVALHPDVGVQYNIGQSTGDRFVPALAFQWIGYQWWDGYDGEKINGLKGVSLVSTVTDRQGGPNHRVGLMFHFGGYSFAVTSHGGDFAITLNLELGDRLTTMRQDSMDALKKPLKANR